MKAILTTKAIPAYDDLPEERYHFPKTYLRQVSNAVGDWIIYYEPRRSTEDLGSRGGRQAYFATARISRIVSDPARKDHYYALIEEYLPFERAVPFKDGEASYERILTKSDGSTNRGAFGRAVRNISDEEYDLILQAGFAHIISEQKIEHRDGYLQRRYEFSDQDQEIFEYERPVVQRLISRPFRERAFVTAVKDAYENACAMTGLKIINGGGRAEVQAAHIRPVEENGPDSVRNGLALSGTIHWLFDRHLLAVDEDYKLLVAKEKVPDTIMRILNSDMKLRMPHRLENWAHPKFLEFHRRKFKG